MSKARALIVSTVVFVFFAALLGIATLFFIAVFLFGMHGGGPLPEWSHLPVLIGAGFGVGLLSWHIARRVWLKQMAHSQGHF